MGNYLCQLFNFVNLICRSLSMAFVLFAPIDIDITIDNTIFISEGKEKQSFISFSAER